MRNLLAFLSAAVLVLAGFGWYLGWYKVHTIPAAEGHRAVNIDIDSKKIGQDLHKGEEKIQETLDKRHKEDGSKRAESTKTGPTKSVTDPE